MERIERRWQQRTDSTRDQSPETLETVTVSEQLVVRSDPVADRAHMLPSGRARTLDKPGGMGVDVPVAGGLIARTGRGPESSSRECAGVLGLVDLLCSSCRLHSWVDWRFKADASGALAFRPDVRGIM